MRNIDGPNGTLFKETTHDCKLPEVEDKDANWRFVCECKTVWLWDVVGHEWYLSEDRRQSWVTYK